MPRRTGGCAAREIGVVFVPDRELIPLIRSAFERGQRVRLTGTGRSMRPFIHDRDVVELEAIHSMPRLGDIVQVQSSAQRCILHRVVRTNGQTFFLRGDALGFTEGPFTPNDLLGRVVATHRNGRARAHDRGPWRFAGRLWVVFAPYGLPLLRLTAGLRRIEDERRASNVERRTTEDARRTTHDGSRTPNAGRRTPDAGRRALLLLDLLRTDHAEDRSGKLARLDGTAWSELISDAERHRVSSLLDWRMKDAEPAGDAMVDAMARLRHAYYAEAGRAVLRRQGLSRLLKALSEAGMPVIVLKGAYLAEAVYPSIALRSMDDVDLLVPKSELSRAQAILLELGYGSLKREEVESAGRGRKHLEPLRKDGLAIEVHWTIVSPANPFRIDHAGIWDRAPAATIAGVEVRVLCPEDTLLHLCLHMAFEHAFRTGPRPLIDIAELSHSRELAIDWPALVSRAHEWRAARYAGVALSLAEEIAGASVPEGVSESLAPTRLTGRVRDMTRQRLLAAVESNPARFPDITVLLGDERLGVRLARLGKAVFPSARAMAGIYRAAPCSLKLCAGYASRPGQAVVYYTRDAWRILRMRRWLSGPF
jgi:hypothetical protein